MRTLIAWYEAQTGRVVFYVEGATPMESGEFEHVGTQVVQLDPGAELPEVWKPLDYVDEFAGA